MENEISTTVDALIRAELAQNEEIIEKDNAAKQALSDLYLSIENLYNLRKGARSGLVDINDFINSAYNRFVGINIESFGKRKDEIIELLNNISWSVREVISKMEQFERDVKNSVE